MGFSQKRSLVVTMFVLTTFLLASIIFQPRLVFAQTQAWYYPIANYQNRQSYKAFGQYIDKAFYVGKTQEFPNQFIGYHAGKDLEIFPNELNEPVPVYAVTDGKILFAGPVSGYGGLILETLNGQNNTALYGHISLPAIKVHTGDRVTAGQQLTVLGDAFSAETGGERKHLHFAILKGTQAYFAGYEPTLAALNAHFVDPTPYLASKNATDITAKQVTTSTSSSSPQKNSTTPPSVSPVSSTLQISPVQSFLQKIKNFLMRIF